MNHPFRANGHCITVYVHGWRRSGVPALARGRYYVDYLAHVLIKQYDIFVVLSRSDSNSLPFFALL
jgi:hypothetical protein